MDLLYPYAKFIVEIDGEFLYDLNSDFLLDGS